MTDDRRPVDSNFWRRARRLTVRSRYRPPPLNHFFSFIRCKIQMLEMETFSEMPRNRRRVDASACIRAGRLQKQFGGLKILIPFADNRLKRGGIMSCPENVQQMRTAAGRRRGSPETRTARPRARAAAREYLVGVCLHYCPIESSRRGGFKGREDSGSESRSRFRRIGRPLEKPGSNRSTKGKYKTG